MQYQDRRLPLHYAAEKGATLEVVKLLLGSESNAAATATAADKVRRSANTTARAATAPRPPCAPYAPSLATLAAGRLG